MSWNRLLFLILIIPASVPASGQITSHGGTGPAGSIPRCPGSALCPEIDARGIPVFSAPAEAPAGYNQPARNVPAGSPMPVFAPPTSSGAGPLPPCTRGVTDRCTQTYERGRAR